MLSGLPDSISYPLGPSPFFCCWEIVPLNLEIIFVGLIRWILHAYGVGHVDTVGNSLDVVVVGAGMGVGNLMDVETVGRGVGVSCRHRHGCAVWFCAVLNHVMPCCVVLCGEVLCVLWCCAGLLLPVVQLWAVWSRAAKFSPVGTYRAGRLADRTQAQAIALGFS